MRPAGIAKLPRRRRKDDLVARLIQRGLRAVGRLRIDQGQVPQDRINIALFRLAESEALRSELNRRTLVREAPCQEGATIDGMFEPGIQVRRDVAVQEDLHRLLLFARKLADLQAADVRRGLPVHMPRTLKSFVRPNPVEVLAQAAVVSLDFAGNSQEQILEPRARIDGGIDRHFPPQRDPRRFLQETERERGGEGKAVLAVRAPLRKTDFHDLFQRGAAEISGKYTPDFRVGLEASEIPSVRMENDGMTHF